MSNKLSAPGVSFTKLQALAAGDMFKFPDEDDIYMRTTHSEMYISAVSLSGGQIHLNLSQNTEVIPVNQVTITKEAR